MACYWMNFNQKHNLRIQISSMKMWVKLPYLVLLHFSLLSFWNQVRALMPEFLQC